jgi:hypothetical protein
VAIPFPRETSERPIKVGEKMNKKRKTTQEKYLRSTK